MNIAKVGDEIPQVKFQTLTDNGIETLLSNELFEGKKVLIVGVIGAFTPVCTKEHLPDFVPFAAELKKGGLVDKIICISAVDPFVLNAWRSMVDPQNKIMMLTDCNAVFAKKLGLSIDLSHLGLGTRSTRYAMLLENSIIKMLNIEEDPQNVKLTNAKAIAKFFRL